MAEHRIFAALYDRLMASAERAVFGPLRAELLGELAGAVLDVGAGTGANLRYFRNAGKVVAAEPDGAMRGRLQAKVHSATVQVEVSDAAAESLPFADGTFDAVVFTLVLCTVGDPARALTEARRVLKPGGRLVVLEHVRGTGRLAGWQDRITPLWRLIGAGCHPNRDTRTAILHAGFEFEQVGELQPFPALVPTRPVLRAVAVAGPA